jgi:hypothetical protein
MSDTDGWYHWTPVTPADKGKLGAVDVRRDGRTLETFQGPDAANDAFAWLLRHQPMSTDWAIKYEGYSIVERYPDGTEKEIGA